MEEVDQGDADASEDSKQVSGKREKVKTYHKEYVLDTRTVFKFQTNDVLKCVSKNAQIRPGKAE